MEEIASGCAGVRSLAQITPLGGTLLSVLSDHDPDALSGLSTAVEQLMCVADGGAGTRHGVEQAFPWGPRTEACAGWTGLDRGAVVQDDGNSRFMAG